MFLFQTIYYKEDLNSYSTWHPYNYRGLFS